METVPAEEVDELFCRCPVCDGQNPVSGGKWMQQRSWRVHVDKVRFDAGMVGQEWIDSPQKRKVNVRKRSRASTNPLVDDTSEIDHVRNDQSRPRIAETTSDVRDMDVELSDDGDHDDNNDDKTTEDDTEADSDSEMSSSDEEREIEADEMEISDDDGPEADEMEELEAQREEQEELERKEAELEERARLVEKLKKQTSQQRRFGEVDGDEDDEEGHGLGDNDREGEVGDKPRGEEEEEDEDEEGTNELQQYLDEAAERRRQRTPTPTPPAVPPSPAILNPPAPPPNKLAPDPLLLRPPPPDTNLDGSLNPLDPEVQVQWLFFSWISRYSIQDAAFVELAQIVEHIGGLVKDGEIDEVKVGTKAQINSIMKKVSGLVELRVDMCSKGCISYGDPQYETLTACPFKSKVKNPETEKMQTKRCDQPRYKPLTQKEKNKKNPPSHGEPLKQWTFFPHLPLIDAISSNPVTSRSTFDFNRKTMIAIEQNSTRITDISDAHALRDLRRKEASKPLSQRAIPNDYTIFIGHASDGAEFFDDRNPREPIQAHFTVSIIHSFPLSLRFKPFGVWRAACVGRQKMKDPQSFQKTYEADLLSLQKLRPRWNGYLKRWVETSAALLLKAADTIEVRDLQRSSGATGKLSCVLCCHVGVQNLLSPSHWYPAFLAPLEAAKEAREAREGEEEEVQPEEEVQQRQYRGFDFDLEVEGAELQPPEKRRGIVYKTWDMVKETVKRLRSPNLKKKVKDEIKRDTGIQGNPCFSALRLARRLFPWFWTLDNMHLLWVNDFPLSLNLLFGKIKSKWTSLTKEAPINPTVLARIELLQMSSRCLKPTSISGAIRSISSKFGDFKAWETKNFVTQELVYARLHHDDQLDPNISRFLLVATKIGILLQRKAIETSPDFDPDTFDLAHIPPDGVPIVPIAVLKPLLHEYVYLREKFFYDRDPAYLNHITTASAHRIIHECDQLTQVGPGCHYSEDTLETIIGLDERKVGSRQHPVENLVSIHRRNNISLLMYLKYLLPILKPHSLSKTITHSKFPELVLLHPRVVHSHLPEVLEEPLKEWLKKKKLKAKEGEVVKMGRLKLGNGDIVRSGFSEHLPPLAKRGRWDDKAIEEGERLLEEGEDKVWKENSQRSARFVKLNDHHGYARAAEVIAFYSVSLEDGSSRIVALVDLFPLLEPIDGVAEVFDRVKDRKRVVVGVERIRGSIGLARIWRETGKTEELMGVVHKAGHSFEPLREM